MTTTLTIQDQTLELEMNDLTLCVSELALVKGYDCQQVVRSTNRLRLPLEAWRLLLPAIRQALEDSEQRQDEPEPAAATADGRTGWGGP